LQEKKGGGGGKKREMPPHSFSFFRQQNKKTMHEKRREKKGGGTGCLSSYLALEEGGDFRRKTRVRPSHPSHVIAGGRKKRKDRERKKKRVSPSIRLPSLPPCDCAKGERGKKRRLKKKWPHTFRLLLFFRSTKKKG